MLQVGAFYCEPINGRLKLALYPEIECWTSDHLKVVLPAMFGLIYVIITHMLE